MLVAGLRKGIGWVLYARRILIEILLVKNGTAIAIATAASRSIQGPESDSGVAVTSPTMYCGGLEGEEASPAETVKKPS